jgi:tRNA threonylcarbamoyladenosine biosynthesis protein TsaE
LQRVRLLQPLRADGLRNETDLLRVRVMKPWREGGRRPVVTLLQVQETVTSSPEETEAVAAALARGLASGALVTVSGELGSGKTTFVRGACRALGVTSPVTSPTFTIGHRYAGARGDVSHLDLYRFVGVAAEEWGDLEPYFDEAIVFVEWPEAGEGWLPAPAARVTLRHSGLDRRTVTIDRC